MPGFDGTGPLGQGPMTGGGRGYCAIPVIGTNFHPVYSFTNYIPAPYAYPYSVFPVRRFNYLGRFGRGRGRGFVHRRWLW